MTATVMTNGESTFKEGDCFVQLKDNFDDDDGVERHSLPGEIIILTDTAIKNDDGTWYHGFTTFPSGVCGFVEEHELEDPAEYTTPETFFADEGFVTCPKCGARTDFTEVAVSTCGAQVHKCLWAGCGYIFTTEIDPEVEEAEDDE